MGMEPKIRYNGYIKEWDNVCLNDIVSTAGVKNRENLPLVSFSITNDQGFIPQDDKFENGGTMRDANKSMYYIVSPKTFAYNPARINVGSIGYYNLEKNVIISSLYVVFKTDQEKCDDYYFLQWFKSDKFKRLIEQYQEGGVRLYFFYDKLCKCHIHIPSKEEQHKISSYFKVFDAKLQASAKKVEALKKLKAASLISMFPQNGESIPKVRFKGFDGEWSTDNLGSIFMERIESNEQGEMLSVTMNNGIIKASDNGRFDNSNSDKSKYKVVKIGDIAYNSMRMWQGASGVSQHEGIVSPAYTVVTPIMDVDTDFFGYLFKTNDVIRLFKLNSQGLTSDNWNLKYPAFSKICVSYPKAKAEQQAIASFFRSLDRKIALETARLEKFKQIKLACLDKMFV
jgi:Restriction endonuclease S subunits